MYGHGLFSPFFAPWVLKLALENSAIVMSPDHRLLPSKNVVADVIQDLEDVWKWMRSDLHIVLGKHVPGISIDLSHTLITGGSAGGYGAIQLALSHPNEISAVAIAYPLVDPKDDLMTGGPSPGEPTILRFPLADIPKKESIILGSKKPERLLSARQSWREHRMLLERLNTDYSTPWYLTAAHSIRMNFCQWRGSRAGQNFLRICEPKQFPPIIK